jgi:hypothetical protein
MKNYLLMFGFGLLSCSLYSCNQIKSQDKKMDAEPNWTFGLTSPKGYPIEVQGGGYLGDDKHMISAIPNNGIMDNGWGGTGTPDAAGGGTEMPTHLSLTWLSFAEKKFWKIDATLPKDKIQALFKTGYMDKDRLGVVSHVTYEYLTAGLAPGGVVVLWVSGHNATVEVGRFQAKEAKVGVDDFAPVKGAFKNSEDFFDEGFKDVVSKESKAHIKTYGIPYGLWDTYRQRYNWGFTVQFYKPDVEEQRHCVYLNGEEEMLKGKNLTAYGRKALPYQVDFYFKEKWAETEFDDTEVMNAFKELTKNNNNGQIEIVAKVAFQYTTMTFVAKAGNKEIALHKVKVGLYPNH